MTTLAYLGNFGPPNSTENDLAHALERLGCTVIRLQEELRSSWRDIDHLLDGPTVDMILWTRTASLAAQIPHPAQRRMQFKAAQVGVPTVGYHLDRWWGLSREDDVFTEPWFQNAIIFTADGAHDPEWQSAGINHHYMPPAIAKRKVMRGAFREDYAFDVAFVGSWRGGYHEEWQHRPMMIDHLRKNWGSTLGLFPQGNERIDGPDRADLFASAKVIVGDSCLVPLSDGSPMHHYCSDRVFETIGQRGLLLHPKVDGIIGDDQFNDLLISGVHCLSWTLWDWDDLDAQITAALALTRAESGAIKTAGFQEVGANHTYDNRMADMLDVVLPVAS